MSYYFETVLRLPEALSHPYAAIPPLAMAVGMPLGGWLSSPEHARRTAGSRKIVPMLGMLAGAVLLIGGVSAREPAWIVTWFALALGAVGMAEGPSWATAIDLGGRRGGSSACSLQHRRQRRRHPRPDRHPVDRPDPGLGLCRLSGRADLSCRGRPLALDRPS